MSVKDTRNTNTRKKGFMLPDVMIAVFVTATALVTIMAALAPAFKLEFFKRDEIIATGLAQEGIELVRNVRDNNWKTCTPAGTVPCAGANVPKVAFDLPFPIDGIYCTDYAKVGSLVPLFPLCVAATNDYITPNNISGAYSTSASGRFQRTITVTTPVTVPVGATRLVTSIVTWGTAPATHTVTLTNTLTNWGNK